ncbi:MAG: hypothetical protein RBU37_26485 [Myxococcota bacterium]|jgi:hypothetical protein|nr:hypothetical protein [Myxococcota bacterium]
MERAIQATSTASGFVNARAAVALEQSRLSRWAKSRWTTLLVVSCELAESVAVALLADRLLAQALRAKPYIDHSFSMSALLGALAVFGYLCLGLELFIRYREPRPSRTLPLVFLPFGRQLRFALIIVGSILLLLPKLLAYFLYLTVAIPLIAISSRLLGGAGLRLIDRFDVLMEPLEHALGMLYNFLHYNKIEGRRSIFDPLFNVYLTLWCMNH